VCRTKHEGCAAGLRVYRDAHDRWAGSRKVWNQHAYFVTNVEETGEVPVASQAQSNWQVAGLNNFRQNVQGEVGPLPSPDLTVKDVTVQCQGGQIVGVQATVCNRGAVGADANVAVLIVATSGTDTAECTATTSAFLSNGFCEDVQCALTAPGDATVQATVNPTGAIGECDLLNNESLPVDGACS
jgi:hypothetical protein